MTNNDWPRGRKGLASFFKFPNQKSFGVPDPGQLTPMQERRVRQLVASLTTPKTKATAKPAKKTLAVSKPTKPLVMKPGWRMVLPAEFGGTVDNAHFQLIRRA